MGGIIYEGHSSSSQLSFTGPKSPPVLLDSTSSGSPRPHPAPGSITPSKGTASLEEEEAPAETRGRGAPLIERLTPSH